MAVQALGDDEASKIDLAIRIAGTVDPPLWSSQIGDRQLEQEPASPVEIGLSSSARPDHHVDPLRSRSTPHRVDAGLVERTVAPLHLEMDAPRPGAQNVVPLGKGSPD